MNHERYLTPKQTAEYIGSSTSTLAKWRMRGTGPKYTRALGRAVRYRQSDLDAYMASHLVPSTFEQVDND